MVVELVRCQLAGLPMSIPGVTREHAPLSQSPAHYYYFLYLQKKLGSLHNFYFDMYLLYKILLPVSYIFEMRCCGSGYQPSCIISQQSWFGAFCFINFPILPRADVIHKLLPKALHKLRSARPQVPRFPALDQYDHLCTQHALWWGGVLRMLCVQSCKANDRVLYSLISMMVCVDGFRQIQPCLFLNSPYLTL